MLRKSSRSGARERRGMVMAAGALSGFRAGSTDGSRSADAGKCAAGEETGCAGRTESWLVCAQTPGAGLAPASKATSKAKGNFRSFRRRKLGPFQRTQPHYFHDGTKPWSLARYTKTSPDRTRKGCFSVAPIRALHLGQRASSMGLPGDRHQAVTLASDIELRAQPGIAIFLALDDRSRAAEFFQRDAKFPF